MINNAKNINVVGASAAVTPVVTITNADALNITAAGADTNLNASLYTGVKAVNLKGGTANSLTVTEGELASTYGIVSNQNAGISNNVTVRALDLTGTSNVIKLAANGAGLLVAAPSGTTNNVATLAIGNTTGIEGISLDLAGANNIAITGTATADTDLASFTATGAGTGSINVSGLTNVETFDLSATTGANTLNFVSGLQSSTTILGGTGANTLRVTQSGVTSSNISATGVETLRLSTGATANGTVNFKTAPNFTTIQVDGDTAEDAVTVTLNKIGATGAINYVGDGLTANTGSTQEFRALNVTSSYTGDADEVTLTFGNKGQTLGSGAGYKVEGTTTLNGVETLNINVNDIGAAGRLAFATGLSGNALTDITVVTAGDVRLGTVTATGVAGDALGGTLSSIDLSGVTGTTQSTLSIANNSISASTVVTAAVNGTDLTVSGAEASSDSLEFIGSAAADKVTASTFDGVLIASGGAGNDEFTGGTNADSIQGGDGDDIFNASAGNDVVSGGAGNDTFKFTAALIEANSGTTATYNGGTGTNNITLTDKTTGLVDADLRGFSNIQTLNLTGDGAIAALGDNAIAAGIKTVAGASGANDTRLNVTKGFAEQSGLTLSYGTDTGETLSITNSGSVDLTNATITQLDSLILAADAGADAVVIKQGIFGVAATASNATITLTNAVDGDNDTIQINKGTVAWDAAAVASADLVDAAGEYFLGASGTDGSLVYYDQGIAAVVTVTITGLDAGAVSITGTGNLLFTA